MRLLFCRFGGYDLFFFHHFIFFRHFAGDPAKIPAARLEYRQRCRTGQNFWLLTGFDIVALLEIAGYQRENPAEKSPSFAPLPLFPPFAPLLKPAKCTGSSIVTIGVMMTNAAANCSTHRKCKWHVFG